MGLPPLITAMLDTGAFPEAPSKVELRQTHISYLLFTPENVYKIKKPVDFGFLDFTTLDKRRELCEEEVRLNRRLTNNVYLGVVDITEDDGVFRVEGPGPVVECAVMMRRLPEDSFLSSLLARGAATEDIIKRVAHRIAEFHQEAATSEHISDFGSPYIISGNADENFIQTRPQMGETISEALFDSIFNYTHGFLADNRSLFESRVAGGFIRDCHGDIHADHVSITDGINIFDCIEFNERFRFSDVVADIAFLSMDLDYIGRTDLARVLEKAYFTETGDKDGARLMDFYKCYRAYVRAKVDGFKYFEPEVGAPAKRRALLSSIRHYHLAGQYAAGGVRPVMVVICGLSGTGKTTVANSVGREFGMRVLSSDVIRKQLAGLTEDADAGCGYKEGIYTAEFTERTYAEMIRLGAEEAKKGRSVVLDATFIDRRYLARAAEAAEGAGAEFRVVECTAGDDIVKERMDERCAETGGLSDADWGIYLKQKAEREPIETEHSIVDTTGAPEEVVVEAARMVFG